MKLLIAATMATLATLACADVSHLGSYNYRAPITTDLASFTPKQSYTQTHVHPQVESIKSSIPISSFTIHQNVGQGNNFGQQGYSGGQSSGYNYNSPAQQHFSAPSTGAVQQAYSGPASVASQRSYLPPAPQQHNHSPASIDQSTLAGPAPAPIHQLLHAPVHQQSYSAPAAAPFLQQSFSSHGPAPIQQSYSAPAVLQQQSYSSEGQSQEKSFEFSGHEQQSFGGIGSTSSVGSGAYNYQAPLSAAAPLHTGFSAPTQQTFSAPASVQQQSFPSSSQDKSGSYNIQPAASAGQSFTSPIAAPVQQTFSAPATAKVHQALTSASGGESGVSNYQSLTQFSGPVQQTPLVPSAIPVQLAVSSGATGLDSGSYNHQAPGSVQTAAPVSHSQGSDNSIPAPKKITLPIPNSELVAPALTPEVGTAYGTNGGYVYRKF